MGKVITSLQFVTQSAPSTPPSTHGNIFASASTLYFKNSDGVEYDLASTSGSIRISYYTGSATTQTYNYIKLGNLKYLKVICVGAGGGGGGGSVRNIAARFGGKGGGGGAIVITQFKASEIPSNVTITTGARGIGGAPTGSTNAFGKPGTNGGNTSFGSLVIAAGGTGGNGGVFAQSAGINGGLGGLMSNCIPSSGQYVLPGFNGGGHFTTNTPTAFAGGFGETLPATYALTRLNDNNTGQAIAGCGGGGGGGSVGAFPVNLHYAGGSGSGVSTNNMNVGATTGTPSQSISPGENGGNNLGTDALLGFLAIGNDINFNSQYGLGAGGSGGGSLGGNGGNGGDFGAGGGGGGCSTITSGAGGNGGAGLCILIEYF
jgi:hypothetical protein